MRRALVSPHQTTFSHTHLDFTYLALRNSSETRRDKIYLSAHLSRCMPLAHNTHGRLVSRPRGQEGGTTLLSWANQAES